DAGVVIADRQSAPAPPQVTPTASTTPAKVFSFRSNMAFTTPSVRATTWVETPAAPGSAANRMAAVTVTPASRCGSVAEAAPPTHNVGKAPAERANPRRARRVRSNARARANRTEAVPAGQPRRRAASS